MTHFHLMKRKVSCCTVNNGKNGMSHFCVIIIAYVVISVEHRVQDLYGSGWVGYA